MDDITLRLVELGIPLEYDTKIKLIITEQIIKEITKLTNLIISIS